MRFVLTDEQQQLQDTARSWAENSFGADVARRAHECQLDLSAGWKSATELGWPSLLVPESHGGQGASLVEASIVVEAAAGGLCPLPLVGHTLAVAAALATESDQVLSMAAEDRPVTIALSEDLTTITSGLAGVVLGHTPAPVVAHLSASGALGVADNVECRPLTASALPGLLGSVTGLPTGSPLDEVAAERWLAAARVVLSAALLGHGRRVLDLAVAHVTDRVQFGRPVGSFQAVQHLLADALVAVETCRSVTYGAAWSVDHDPHRGPELAAAAFAWAAHQMLLACESSLQAHGGIGFTWECEVHLHLRSVVLLGALLGGGARAEDNLGAAVLDGTWGG